MTAALITGTGAITSLGSCVEDTWSKIHQNCTGLNVLDQGGCFAALVPDVGAKDRLYKLARISLDECMAEAGWSAPLDGRTALIFATGSPDNEHIIASGELYNSNGRIRPDTVYKMMYSYVAARLGGDMKLRGPVYAISAACAGSSQAIHLAHSLLASNAVDRVLCGGGEVLDRYTLAAFVAMRSVVTTRVDLGTGAVQPFGAERSGIALGEGCGWLALTRAEDGPSSHGSEIVITESSVMNVPEATYGDVVDLAEWSRLIGSSVDAKIDFIMAHATSTPKGDLAEGEALLHHFPNVQVSSTKYMLGHTLSASTVLDVIMMRQMMKSGKMMAAGHDYRLDPALSSLRLSKDVTCRQVKRAMKLSAAFGGSMGKLILEIT